MLIDIKKKLHYCMNILMIKSAQINKIIIIKKAFFKSNEYI